MRLIYVTSRPEIRMSALAIFASKSCLSAPGPIQLACANVNLHEISTSVTLQKPEASSDKSFDQAGGCPRVLADLDRCERPAASNSHWEQKLIL